MTSRVNQDILALCGVARMKGSAFSRSRGLSSTPGPSLFDPRYAPISTHPDPGGPRIDSRSTPEGLRIRPGSISYPPQIDPNATANRPQIRPMRTPDRPRPTPGRPQFDPKLAMDLPRICRIGALRCRAKTQLVLRRGPQARVCSARALGSAASCCPLREAPPDWAHVFCYGLLGLCFAARPRAERLGESPRPGCFSCVTLMPRTNGIPWGGLPSKAAALVISTFARALQRLAMTASCWRRTFLFRASFGLLIAVVGGRWHDRARVG